MTSFTGLSPNNPRDYVGPNVALNTVVTRNRAPTGADYRQPETGKLYPFNTYWLVGKNPTTGVQGDLWYLSKIAANVAYWLQLSTGASGPLLNVTVPNGVSPIIPDGAGTMNFTSSGGTVVITGSSANPNNHTINFDIIGAVGPFESIVVQKFTTPGAGTYTPTVGMKYCIVECVGAGGGGGGAGPTADYAAGSGGGGGSYSKAVFSAATIGASKSYVVGTGGVSGTNAGTDGTDGIATTFGSGPTLITTIPGLRGLGHLGSAVPFIVIPLGGGGAVQAAGQFNSGGGSGGFASYDGGSLLTSGFGGNSGFGSVGGAALQRISSVNNLGGEGFDYGAGGGGGLCIAGSGARGGAGANGVIYITEYV